MDDKKVLEFAKKNGYSSIKYVGKWKGFDVYDLIYSDDEEEASYIGLPLVALVKNDDIRISTGDESLEILSYFYPDDDE